MEKDDESKSTSDSDNIDSQAGGDSSKYETSISELDELFSQLGGKKKSKDDDSEFDLSSDSDLSSVSSDELSDSESDFL